MNLKKKLQEKVFKLFSSLPELQTRQLMLTGKTLGCLQRDRQFSFLKEAEFKVFSQWGEDGIINYIIDNAVNISETFIEIGVQDYSESNTRFLLKNRNWNGLIIDGAPDHLSFLKTKELDWKFPIKALQKFITKENINQVLSEYSHKNEIGLLSLDIDGVDYWVLKEILKEFTPQILTVEYNGWFGRQRAVTVPYDPQFVRNEKHFSNLYYGASLSAFYNLAKEHNYIFLGVNSVGSNAFFIQKNISNNLKESNIDKEFHFPTFKESRDKAGNLNYVTDQKQVVETLSELEVFDIQLDKKVSISDLVL